MKLLQQTRTKFVEQEEKLIVEGPTPRPGLIDLRNWDYRIIDTYNPLYTSQSDTCDYCTFGKCDLTCNKRGACGIDLETHSAREGMMTCIMGAACHTAHARHLLNYFINRYGNDHPIDVGPTSLNAPVTEVIMGFQPETMGDFRPVLDYVEEQLTNLISSAHTGQEGSARDFESKTLHAGMLDHLGMEVAEITQISCLGFPKSDENAPLAEIGMGILDQDKPIVICVGHNVVASGYILDHMDWNGLFDKIEIAGLCCTAHELTRYNKNTKIIGSMSKQLKYIRSGIPDVLVVDEQCVRADILREAKELFIPVIATNDKCTHGLPDRSNDSIDEIIDDLVSGKQAGALILDFEKVGELVPRLAMKIGPIRKAKGITAIPTDEDFKKLVSKCTNCLKCTRDCPQSLPIADAMEAATNGDISKFEHLHEKCVGCGICDNCPAGIPVLNVIEKASQRIIKLEKGRVRIGKGQISDDEIIKEAMNLELGITPGVIALVGCSNYPDGTKGIYDVAEEMLERGYIVLTSGCSAMDIGLHKNADGKTLYERYTGKFSRGNLLNAGSCVSNAHIGATTIKIASILAGIQTKGNYEEIADFVLNAVGAVGIAWGAFSQKAFAIATGCNRLGIPVVTGPQGAKYRRALIGKPYKKEEGGIMSTNDDSIVNSEPAPEHLMITAETKDDLLPLIAKLCIRPGDTSTARAVKLTHYIELSEKYLKKMPDDWHIYVRNETDIPIAKKEQLLKLLDEKRRTINIDKDKEKIIGNSLLKFGTPVHLTNIPPLCEEV
ncbi:MAG: acetyl-CoA decarbonylase/synthase complex subunit alpha [Candidatus Argoarchaeum ethanivorans]|uniref:Acetyl-CoA decarbonylase/synthase complex subunit alpha n=1 Tax=Candidatus Argoarchaeum ethanivorans TaxID=2608793 RepID=A0A8B3S6H1_9EURY|nr:MAG: acetyl-CoA decarbonylase/synthase complex subunit alpha [Candidatus Argoarchaeum ethanivorans]